MKFFIAARKDTKEVLEFGANSLDFDRTALTSEEIKRGIKDIPMIRFRQALCVNKGIDDSNLEFYYVDKDDAGAQMVMDGGSYELVWSGDSIIGIDATPETSKRILKAHASKPEIVADGTDTTTVTIEIWKADGSSIDQNINTTTDIPIVTPSGKRRVNVTFTNGVASRDFKTTKDGEWQFPMRMKRYKTVRIGTIAEVESILNFSDM